GVEDGRRDVMLRDLMMREMDGFRVVAAMQKPPAWRRIPVIVITARDLTAEDRARLNSGIETVLMKETFNPASLVERVREAAAKSRRLQQVAEGASGFGSCTERTTTTTSTCSRCLLRRLTNKKGK